MTDSCPRVGKRSVAARGLLFPCWCLLMVATARGGDAVAIAYNSAGVWTAVTYYCSSSPPGGADYKDAAGARLAATKDLKKRAGEDLARQSVIAASDKTGHFAYARGKNPGGKDVHAVGYAPASEAGAEKDAFEQLNRSGAKVDQKVIYKYFSYGSEAAAEPGKKS